MIVFLSCLRIILFSGRSYAKHLSPWLRSSQNETNQSHENPEFQVCRFILI